ncbi:MAG: CPBP family intramembrane metalloprotease [Planctomycetia bacterium]|nr:CPBP family intramembrane metalloprotease [Planctomycetia bacterium]
MIDPQAEPNSEIVSPAHDPGPLPAADVFLNVADVPPADAVASPLPAPRRLGPGFWESIAWMVGFYVVQIGATLLACAVLVAAFIVSAGVDSGGSNPAALVRSLWAQFSAHLVTITGAAQVATIVFGLMAIRLRFGASGLHDLGFQRPWRGHWLLVTLLLPPLCLLCTVLQSAAGRAFPVAHDEMQELMRLFSEAPLQLLVLVVGLGPGLGEELLFRGLIGRGLVARWGLAPGILATSVLFAVMHLNPAQAIAVLPIGLALHFVYYTTRSFWAPVTLHFANNALSMILLKNSNSPAVTRFDQIMESQGGLPPYVLVASVAMITAIIILLWQTRVQYVLPDGSVWNPGYATAGAPPAELNARLERQEPRLLMLAGSTFNSLGFAAGLWRMVDWVGLTW